MKTGSSTRRKMAPVSDGPHDRPTLRAVPNVPLEVSESQVVETAAATPNATLSDLATVTFFNEGNRQEEEGVFRETSQVRIRSLDRVPRSWSPRLLALALLIAAAAGGLWWLGFRPPAEWQRSEIWQRLHLPKLPPPA